MSDKFTVEIDNLVKKYGSVIAVDGVSIDVEEGEFFSLLGPSGCGKTTTLRSIAGFEQPTEGAVYIDGENQIGVPSYDRDTGMVFQGFALFPHKTVGENVGFGLKMQGVPEDDRKEQVAEALELVNLPGVEDRSPKELSGGQQQRVALARALVIEPSVLLLDEPLASLDLKLRKQMRYELSRIQDELDITTIYVTHDQEEALSMSDRIAVLNEGRVEQIGSPVDIYNYPANEFVADFIGETNLLGGTLVSKNGSHTVALEELDGRVSVFPDGNIHDLGEDEEVVLSIRPENIEVSLDGSSQPNALSGTVENRTFLGKVTQYVVDLGGEEAVVEVRRRDVRNALERGDEVTIEWNEEDCLLIPA